jgi:hypothetical protein
MSGAARRRKPLILMSDDVEPAHWDASGESDIVARLAVCQDLWGRHSFAPGQYQAMRQAATALAINKSQIYGAIGVNLGGFGFVTEEFGAHVELFEADPLLCDFNGSSPHFLGNLVKMERWVPGEQRLKANRYHRLSTFWAFAAAPDPAALVEEITAALKPGGYLYIDEIWANDSASARQLACASSLWQDNLCFRRKGEVLTLFARELDFRSVNEASRLVKSDIRDGLVHAREVTQKLKQVPDEIRKRRLIALTQELQRGVVLFDALDRGAVMATRLVFHKKKKL